MIDTCQIKPDMPVVFSNNGQVATVGHMDANNSIKLTTDESGQHYWVAADWVTQVDEHVHIDRFGQQAMQDWYTDVPH